MKPLYHGQKPDGRYSEKERQRRNKWVQRQRKIGNLDAKPADCPPKTRMDEDIHPPPFKGKLKDREADWLVAMEAAKNA